MARSLEKFRGSLHRLAVSKAREIAAVPLQRPRSAQPSTAVSRPTVAQRPASTATRARVQKPAPSFYGEGFELPPQRRGDQDALMRSRAFWKRLEYTDQATGEMRSVRSPTRSGVMPVRRPASAALPDTSGREDLTLTDEQKQEIEEEIKREQRQEKQLAMSRADDVPEEDVQRLFTRLQTEVRNSRSHARSIHRRRPPPVAGFACVEPPPPPASLTNLQVMFSRLRTLMETLWHDLQVGGDEQREFARLYYYPETIQNYNIMFREVEKLCSHRAMYDKVLELMEFRQACRARLLRLSRRTELLRSAPTALQESAVTEVVSAVWSLRSATCDVVDALYRCREARRRPQTLMRDGANYVATMQGDLDSLSGTPLAKLLAPDICVLGNPLLLPGHVVDGALSKRAEMAVLSTHRMAKAAASAPGQRGSADASFGSAGAKRARFQLRPLSELLPPPKPVKPARVEVLPPNRLIEAATQRPPTERQLYLKTIEDRAAEAHRQQQSVVHRVSARKSGRNVYQYPPEVYQEKVRFEGEGEEGGRCRPALLRLLNPAAKQAHGHQARERSGPGRSVMPAERSMPPSHDDHARLAKDALSIGDLEDCPRPSLSRLLTCEALLFAESAYLKKAASRRKLCHATEKLQAAFRLFTSTLRKRRVTRPGSVAGARERDTGFEVFAGWVQQHAPQWYPEIHRLQRRDASDELGSGDDSEGGISVGSLSSSP
eukprot:TRINITY_DN25454_c0_g1_i1.p1 TRINITY_DN25454_c0_g1~~TRINITY_DN25454_c0_g1_i1.p1  ORF type:complete len:770 (+),score=214.23 TRINITY_DN25454_c0_g1_i1:157-2310(+)